MAERTTPVRPWLRIAGIVPLSEATSVTWSVAEGRQGRRWREASIRDGRLLAARLIELDPTGRFQRLEEVTSAGMLTLHPDAEGMVAEGNVVLADGVRPLRFPWGPGHRVFVADSLAATALAALGLGGEIALGATAVCRVLYVDRELGVHEDTLRVERTAERGWRLSVAGAGFEVAIDLDADGLPNLPGTVRWPLESEPTEPDR